MAGSVGMNSMFSLVFLFFPILGMGFKMGPVTGEILADMVIGKKSKYDVTHFKASRFRNNSSL